MSATTTIVLIAVVLLALAAIVFGVQAARRRLGSGGPRCVPLAWARAFLLGP